MKKRIVKETAEWLIYLSLSVLAAILIITYIGRFTVVDGNSMQPTLQNRNVLILERITVQTDGVHPGDIVVVRIPELLDQHRAYAIKRIIAVEGQHVYIHDGHVEVDGVMLEEDYINDVQTIAGDAMYSDMVVPEDCIYLLGDNRLPDKSRDSRVFGPVSEDRVIGKAWIRIFPFSRFGLIR